MVSDIHRISDGGLDVRNPHALEMADSVNSKFFAPVGNTLITSRETKELLCTNRGPIHHISLFLNRVFF